MLVQQVPEPEEMSVASSFTDIYDVNDLVRHLCFIGHAVSICELFLDQIDSEEELVFQEQFIVSGLMAAFTDDILCLEEIAALIGIGKESSHPVLAISR